MKPPNGVSPERPLSLVIVFLTHAVFLNPRQVLQGSSASQRKRVVVLDMNLTSTRDKVQRQNHLPRYGQNEWEYA